MPRTLALLRKSGAALVLAVNLTLLAAGCSREQGQTQAVGTSSSESGASSAPASSDINRRERALVRVVAAIPDLGPVDVLAGNQVIFPTLKYKAVTEYRELPDDRLTFSVRPAGNAGSQPLAENSEGLSSGSHYTLVAYDKPDGKQDLAAFSDDLTPPTSGKAKIRVIHAAPQIGEVDVYIVGKDTLFSGVDSGSETRDDEVDPMDVTLQIRPEGRQNSLLNIDDVHLEAGKVYTIVVVGHSQRSPRVEAIQIEDRFLGTSTATAQR